MIAGERVTVIVADDEPAARQRLVRLVEATGQATVVAACSGGRETVQQVTTHEPALLFLDVQMPDLDGFAVVEALPAATRPAIVFVTAFDRYALRAFDVHAVDYLLKPFDTARFQEAFAHARLRASAPPLDAPERLRELLRELAARAEPPPAWLDRIAIGTGGSLKVIRTDEIDWLEAQGNYVRLHVGAAQHSMRSSISALASQLDPKRFLRTHRSYIVNVERIVEVQPWFAGQVIVVLRNGAKVHVSRSYRRALHEQLGARAGR